MDRLKVACPEVRLARAALADSDGDYVTAIAKMAAVKDEAVQQYGLASKAIAVLRFAESPGRGAGGLTVGVALESGLRGRVFPASPQYPRSETHPSHEEASASLDD